MNILTAAHCVEEDLDGSSYRVKLGLHDREEKGQTIDVSQITVHPRRNRRTHSHDYAILRLSQAITFSRNVTPVCLPQNEAAVGTNCFVTGWGRIDPRIDELPRKLMQVDIPVVSKDDCTDSHTTLDESMICAGDVSKGGCFGDSGGPFVCQGDNNAWEIQGVVSYGSKTCSVNDNHPTVFAKVVSVIDWIKQTVKS